jgi:hypothetical protein
VIPVRLVLVRWATLPRRVTLSILGGGLVDGTRIYSLLICAQSNGMKDSLSPDNFARDRHPARLTSDVVEMYLLSDLPDLVTIGVDDPGAEQLRCLILADHRSTPTRVMENRSVGRFISDSAHRHPDQSAGAELTGSPRSNLGNSGREDWPIQGAHGQVEVLP